LEEDVGDTPRVGQDQQEKQHQQQQRQPAAVIVIDDDEAEFVNVSDMSCQATFDDIENETSDKEKEKTLNKNQNSSSTAKQTEQSEILKNYVPIRPAPAKESMNSSLVLQTPTSSVLQQTINKQSEVAVSSLTSAGKMPPVIYRTLKSPVESGLPLLPQRVALKSSPPSLPVQQVLSNLKSTSGAASLVSPSDNINRYIFQNSVTLVFFSFEAYACLEHICITQVKSVHA